jgi:hypothetical protein
MKSKLLICMIALVLFSFSYQQQQVASIDLFISKLKSLYQKYPIEKVYLHTDKPYYIAGETLWFKAYLQNSQSDTSDLSKVLYVELISPYMKVQSAKQLFINQLSTFGEFGLADTLSEGIYRVRAYTNHLRNAGTYYFFDKQIQVFNPRNKQKTTPNLSNKQEIDLQFFPEGGDLVYGLRSTVAFKAINPQGMGVAVEGEIYDSEGIKAATFKSNTLGMGSFKLAPALNRVYQARIKLQNGKEASYYLPNIKQSGFVMNLESMPENRLRLRIFANHNGLEGKAKEFFVIAQQNGEVFYSVKDSTGKTALMSDIPKRILPQGIVHFTLFDGNNIAQAERLVFVNHQDFLQFSMGKDKETYSPQQKINVSIFIADAQGQATEADFSISVTDLRKVTTKENEDNLLTNLLLTSELKGNIETPYFYFQNTPESEKALDDLMLTQGWRRFKWKDLINNELTSNLYSIEKGMTIAGLAKGGLGAPFKNANVSVLNAANNIALTGKTDENGRFEIQGLNFEGISEFAIQVENEKKTKAEKIAIISIPPPAVNEKSRTFFDANALTQQMSSITNHLPNVDSKPTQMLQSVTVSSSPLPRDAYKSMKPYGTADATVRNEVLVINAKGTANVLYGLKGQAAGVQIGRDVNGNFGVLIRGGVNSIKGSSTALLLFDGIPVDFDFFNSVNAEDIDHIDIIKSEKATAYGARGSNGAIAVFSRRDYKTVDKSVGLINQKVMGYYAPQEFYSPNYETMKKEARTQSDLRSTIYWNPQVYANTNGVANVSFFASDVATTYRMVIEGRSWAGKLGRKEMIIEVKK